MKFSEIKYFLLTKSVGVWVNILAYFSPQKAKILSYKLFSEPRDGRLDPDDLFEVLKNVPLEYIEHKHHRFPIYQWKNSGATVLLVHGWESNSARWEIMLPFLHKANYNIIAVDAPGHGLASGKEFNIPLYSEFLNIVSRRFKPFAIIGHSLGGATAVHFMTHYSHPLITKMVLLGAPSDLEVLLNNYRNLLGLNRRTRNLLDDYYLENFNLHPVDFSGMKFAKTLDAEVFIAHDVDDKTVKIIEADKLDSGFKNSKYVRTKNLGHALHDDELYGKIMEFLK